MKAPRLADERADRCEALGELAKSRILLGGDAAAARHAERAHLGALELHAAQQREQLRVLGVRTDEPGLDQVDAQPVERLHHPRLLGCRQGHPLSLHAVTQGRVVELYLRTLSQVDAFPMEGRAEIGAAMPRGHGAYAAAALLIRSMPPGMRRIRK